MFRGVPEVIRFVKLRPWGILLPVVSLGGRVTGDDAKTWGVQMSVIIDVDVDGGVVVM